MSSDFGKSHFLPLYLKKTDSLQINNNFVNNGMYCSSVTLRYVKFNSDLLLKNEISYIIKDIIEIFEKGIPKKNRMIDKFYDIL